jgi:hypothetical protein
MYLLDSPMGFYIRLLQNYSLFLPGYAARPYPTSPNPKAVLLHKVYSDSGHCEGHVSSTYKTPLESCYGDGKYYDLYDEIVAWDRNGKPTQIRRIFFYSKDLSCQDLYEGVSYEGSVEMCTGWGDGSEKQLVVFN